MSANQNPVVPQMSDASVALMVPRDQFRINPVPVRQLYDTLGDAGAEQVICRALDDLVLRLERVEDDYHSRILDRIPSEVRRIVVIAEQIGLTEVAVAAAHVRETLPLGGAALAATLARLSRTTDRAVIEIWNGHDRTA